MTRKVFSYILLLALSVLTSAQLTLADPLPENEMQKLFFEANQYFREANRILRDDPEKAENLYRRALLRFEKLTEEQSIDNGKLYYNIGNTYFRLNKVGRAILNYLRAEQFIPGDANLAHNLEFARSRRKDKVEEKTQTRILKTLLFWHYDIPYSVRMHLAGGAFIAFWLFAAVRLFSKKAAPTGLLSCVAIVTLLFLGSVISEEISDSKNSSGVILASEVVGRTGDGVSYAPAFKDPLHEGTEFSLIEKRGEWLHIELQDGGNTWIPQTSAELLW